MDILKNKKGIIVSIILIICIVIGYCIYNNAYIDEEFLGDEDIDKNILNIENLEDNNNSKNTNSSIQNDEAKKWEKENGEENSNEINYIQDANNENSNTNETAINCIKVYIVGCIKEPGVVEIPSNARIDDVINKAGGLTEEADVSKINLASFLEDGMKIYVPKVNESDEKVNYIEKGGYNLINNSNNVESSEDSKTNKNKKLRIININIATQVELETLPGIGKTTAIKIVEYRSNNGKFKSIDDIKNVKGIGKSKFEKIKNYICVK